MPSYSVATVPSQPSESESMLVASRATLGRASAVRHVGRAQASGFPSTVPLSVTGEASISLSLATTESGIGRPEKR